MATVIESLALLIQADPRPALKGLSAVSAGITSFAGGVAGIATSVGSGIMSAGKYLMDFADNDTAKAIAGMTKLAEATGSSVETLSGLQAISGQDFAGFNDQMGKLIKNLAGVELGSDAVRSKLAGFGLDADKLAHQGLDQTIFDIADAYAALPNSIEKAALAQVTFGKSWQKAQGMLAKGSAGLKEGIGKADSFGLTFDAGQGKAVADAVKAVKEFKTMKTGFYQQFVLATAPVALPVAKAFTQVGVSLMAGLKEILPLLKPIGDAIQTAFGPLLKNVGGAFSSGIKTALGFVVPLIAKAVPIVVQYWTIAGAIFETVWKYAVKIGEAVSEWISSFTGNSFDLTGLRDNILTVMIGVEYGIRNIDKVWAVAKASVLLGLATIAAEIHHAWESLPDIVLWATDNAFKIWQGFVTSAGEAYIVFFKTLTTAQEQAFEFIKSGGTSGFDVDALLKPIKDSVANFQPFKDIPPIQLPPRVLSEFEKQFAKELDAASGELVKDWPTFLEQRMKELTDEPFKSFFDFGVNKAKDSGDKAGKEFKAQFAGAAFQGSQEAATAVAKFRFETDLGGANNPQEKQVAEQKKTNKKLDDLIAAQKQGAVPVPVFGIL